MYNRHYSTMISVLIINLVVISASFIYIESIGEIDAQSSKKSKKEPSIPILRDTNLNTELIVDKLQFPSGMDFIGNDDLLVIEKNTGKAIVGLDIALEKLEEALFK